MARDDQKKKVEKSQNKGKLARGKATQGEVSLDEATQGEATLGETTQDGATQGEVTLGETTEGEVTQEEASQGEATQVEATQGEPTQGEVSQGEATQGEATQVEATPGETAVAGAEPAAFVDKQWYVIHTYSGYENKVKTNLEHRVASMDVKDKIFQVVIPMEDEVEVKDGQRRTVQRKIFPGYVLVEMTMGDDSWYVVRNTPGVTGFVGSGNKPVPLQDVEVKAILKQMRAETPRVKIAFSKGQSVRIIDGPFADFLGVVDDINHEKGKVRVLVSFFGRETPVELDFLQIEKL